MKKHLASKAAHEEEDGGAGDAGVVDSDDGDISYGSEFNDSDNMPGMKRTYKEV